MHFGGDDSASEDTTTDGDETGEGAFLVYSRGFSPLIFHANQNAEKSFLAQRFPYRCSCLQWLSWVFGILARRPCAIFDLPYQPVGWPWRSSISRSGKCEAVSGRHALTGRSTRSPWLRWVFVLSCGRRWLGLRSSLCGGETLVELRRARAVIPPSVYFRGAIDFTTS